MKAKFPEYKGLDLPKVAEEILKYWQENNIFEKSVTTREGATPYIFFEGPPSANGLPGVHHVLARAIKDIFPRYKTMKGYQVKRKAGWDTHGLPIELGVEKELGITKEDIGKEGGISVEDYNAACRKAVMRYTHIWNDLTQKMGYWVDMDDPYITYEPKYMESVWWLLKQIYNKKLIYKGYTIQPYSPKAGTGLSSHELNQPGTYQDVTDTTVVAQFRSPLTPKGGNLDGFCKAFKISEEELASSLTPKGGKAVLDAFSTTAESPPLGDLGDFFFLAWTTTPWTLPSNTALTVGPKIEYVLVDTFNQYTYEPTKVILAKKLVAKQFDKKFVQVEDTSAFENYKLSDNLPNGKTGKIPYRILAECLGKDLVGIKYEQLLPYALPYNNPKNAFRVIAGDFVTTEDGTGIVHTAPTFGVDDALVAKQAIPEIPPLLVKDENDHLVPLVDLQGRFRPEMGEFAGKYVKNEYYNDGEAPQKSVDVELAIKLKTEKKIDTIIPYCVYHGSIELYLEFVESQTKENSYAELKRIQEEEAGRIRARMIQFQGAGINSRAISFGEAYDYAKQAESKTGVSAAFIIAIMQQETNLGSNVGGCYVTDLATGDGIGLQSQLSYERVMGSGSLPHFEDIMTRLGEDWKTTPVSCPIDIKRVGSARVYYNGRGYGGAMGYTQFIPSTWVTVSSRVQAHLNVATANPWNPEHAVMATAVYVRDLGASGSIASNPSAYSNAACRYYGQCSGYQSGVMKKAASVQLEIDKLERD